MTTSQNESAGFVDGLPGEFAEQPSLGSVESQRADDCARLNRPREAQSALSQSHALDERSRADGHLTIIRELEQKLAQTQANALDEKARAEGYLTVIGNLERALASTQANASDEKARAEGYLVIIGNLERSLASTQANALDEKNRAEGYLNVIGDLERSLASAGSRALDERNRAEGYLKVIGELEARAARAENRLAALRPGAPPEFPPIDQGIENLRRDLDCYLAAIPDRVELAQYIDRLASYKGEESARVLAAMVYLHFLLGDYDRAYKKLGKIDLAELAAIIPNPQRTWHAFLWLLCNFGQREAAALLLDGLAGLGPAQFEALQLPGATLARQAEARQRGVPAVLFNTTPKSGTVFLQQALARVLDAPIFRISLSGFADDRVVPAMARYFAAGGAVSFNHIPATRENLEALRRSGVCKIVVHVRDPRQCVTSLFMSQQHSWNVEHTVPASGLHFGEDIRPPDDYHEMSAAERQNCVVRQYAPIYCKWIEGWVAAAGNLDGVEVEFVTYEDFVNNKPAYYMDIAKFLGLDADAVVPKLLAIEPKRDVMHFRTGRVDEWREVLTEPERELFWSLMKPSLAEKFGWAR
jgi:hypothetical protein